MVDVDKRTIYNNGVENILVTVDAPSRYLRDQTMLTKATKESVEIVGRVITKTEHLKAWLDEKIEFKGAFKLFEMLCESKSIDIYTENSEAMLASAEHRIRSLKIIT